MAKLNARQLKFIEEYVKLYKGKDSGCDSVGTKAAIAAGYSARSARTTASRMLKNVDIKGRIDELVDKVHEKVVEKTAIDRAWVLEQHKLVYDRVMSEAKVKTEKIAGEEVPVLSDDGHCVFEFDASNALKALKQIGDHRDVQAFKQTLDLNHKDKGEASKTELAAKALALLDRVERRIDGEEEEESQ